MLQAVLMSAFVGVLAGAATPRPVVESTCAATLCTFGSNCKEVYYPSLGVVRAVCMGPVTPTGNEKVCADGQPLYVNNIRGIVEANCGRSSERIDCPSGYACNVQAFDAYAVCCPDFGITATPIPDKAGVCPAPDNIRCLRVKNCVNDNSCLGEQKCCRNRCGGFMCVAPEQSRLTCATVKCSAGYQCVMRFPASCIYRKPCYEEPECVLIKKEGRCPEVVGMISKRPGCQRQCVKDPDCPNDQKCCLAASGCGTSCQDPEPERTCENTRCDNPNHVCVMQQMMCIKAPCFPVPTCGPR